MSVKDEEVEDYMSDTFVPKDDVRPSLLFSHSSKVKHESMKKKLASNKPKRYYEELEHQIREAALDRPLDETNIGFKVWNRMGFNACVKKEPDDQSSAGTSNARVFTSEPIRIRLKNDRLGFGAVEFSTDPIDEQTEEQFLINKRSKNQLFLSEKDLETAQKVCRNLDIDSGFDEKHFLKQTVRPKWFWPPIDTQITDDMDEEVSDEETDHKESVEFKLKTINDYLRDKYFYCIWCGIRFNDKKDLSFNCLGDTRDHHQ